MVKRGLSAEEKKTKLIQILRSAKEPLTLKEVEKLGSKAGIVLQAIKGIVAEIVSDGIVQQYKIGSSNFFWCSPSDNMLKVSQRIEELKGKHATLEKSNEESKKRERELRESRVDTNERREKLARLQNENIRRVMLSEKSNVLKENDPAEIQRITDMVSQARDAANVWTDNVWQVKKWIQNKRGLTGKEVDRIMGLKDDFDYV